MILDIVSPITPITPKSPQNDSKTTPKCLKITPKQRFLLRDYPKIYSKDKKLEFLSFEECKR